MADSLITSGPDLNVDNLKILPPRLNKGGKGKNARIVTSSGNSLHMSSPLMLTWGVNEYEDEQSGIKKYSIALQFPRDQYATEDTRKFLANMQALENFAIQTACDNTKEWFGKPKSKMDRNVVEALWNPFLKYPKDKETGEPDMTRSPTMRVKLRYYEDKFSVELYDVKESPLFKPEFQDKPDYPSPLDILTKGSHVACVIQCGGIYLANGKFGISFNLVQAIVRQPLRIQGSCHVPLSSTDRELIKEENTREKMKQEEEKEQTGHDDIGDGDGEEDEQAEIVDDEEERPTDDAEVEEEPEPEPEPAPKPTTRKKKITKKKK